MIERVARRASWIWVGGLTLLATAWTACMVWLPFDAAAGPSRVVGPAGLVVMIAASELMVRHQEEVRT